MDFDYDEEIVGEAPCEFCGELFPLMLLIEHETIHLGDDNFEFFDAAQNAETENVISTQLKKTEIVEEKLLGSAVETEPEISIIEEKQTTSVALKNELKKAIEEKLTKSVPSTDKKKEEEKIKEFTTETGEKLLVYGNDIDSVRELESNKQMYKMPNNPLLSNLSKEKDIEDINNLSDDDSTESLEEFWKRARDVLKRSRTKNELS